MTRIALPLPEIARRYENGEGIRSLAERFGVGYGTIRRRLLWMGTRLREPASQQRSGFYLTRKGHLRARGRNLKLYRIHRVCWETLRGPIPHSHVVHHVNGDQLDNRIENLACMTMSMHAALHARARRADKKGGSE